MAFEGLAEKLQQAFRKLSSHGKLTESDVKTAMRDVRMALLEADVNYKVVKDFTNKSDRARRRAAIYSTASRPAQHGHQDSQRGTDRADGRPATTRLTYSPTVPTIYMLCGLQGAGKTTDGRQARADAQKQGQASAAGRRATYTAPPPSSSCR